MDAFREICEESFYCGLFFRCSQFSPINKIPKKISKKNLLEMAACDVFGDEFVLRLAAYEATSAHRKAAALEGILQCVGAGTAARTELQVEWVTAGAVSAEEWAGKWMRVNGQTIAKVLGASQVSQEGCLVIDFAARYVTMFPDTSKTIRVHAMLLWNGFLECEARYAKSASEIGVFRATQPSAQGFVLLPLACLLMACKLSGRSRVAPTLEHLVCLSMLVCQGVYGTHEGMDAERVKEVKDALRHAENRVLWTMRWEIDLTVEIEEALELVENRRAEMARSGLCG